MTEKTKMKKEKIIGILVSVIQKEFSGITEILSSRALIIGGPLISFETSIKKKIERIKKLKITHFVDDLKEIIDQAPNNITKILYKNKNFKVQVVKNLIVKDLTG